MSISPVTLRGAVLDKRQDIIRLANIKNGFYDKWDVYTIPTADAHTIPDDEHFYEILTEGVNYRYYVDVDNYPSLTQKVVRKNPEARTSVIGPITIEEMMASPDDFETVDIKPAMIYYMDNQDEIRILNTLGKHIDPNNIQTTQYGRMLGVGDRVTMSNFWKTYRSLTSNITYLGCFINEFLGNITYMNHRIHIEAITENMISRHGKSGFHIYFDTDTDVESMLNITKMINRYIRLVLKSIYVRCLCDRNDTVGTFQTLSVAGPSMEGKLRSLEETINKWIVDRVLNDTDDNMLNGVLSNLTLLDEKVYDYDGTDDLKYRLFRMNNQYEAKRLMTDDAPDVLAGVSRKHRKIFGVDSACMCHVTGVGSTLYTPGKKILITEENDFDKLKARAYDKLPPNEQLVHFDFIEIIRNISEHTVDELNGGDHRKLISEDDLKSLKRITFEYVAIDNTHDTDTTSTEDKLIIRAMLVGYSPRERDKDPLAEPVFHNIHRKNIYIKTLGAGIDHRSTIQTVPITDVDEFLDHVCGHSSSDTGLNAYCSRWGSGFHISNTPDEKSVLVIDDMYDNDEEISYIMINLLHYHNNTRISAYDLLLYIMSQKLVSEHITFEAKMCDVRGILRCFYGRTSFGISRYVPTAHRFDPSAYKRKLSVMMTGTMPSSDF